MEEEEEEEGGRQRWHRTPALLADFQKTRRKAAGALIVAGSWSENVLWQLQEFKEEGRSV